MRFDEIEARAKVYQDDLDREIGVGMKVTMTNRILMLIVWILLRKP